MSNNGNTLYNNLFSSILSDIKSYSGKDPLPPWLRGINNMKEALPNELLRVKLPRFLEKCAETFLTDRRYSNDLRYLRVWLQLMDFVDDPKPVLRTMEKNHIGMKKSLFYQAYALYYEKMKKFDAAEKIYHMGVQNLAEPADELQKSFEQFLQRMERHRKKRAQHQERKMKSSSQRPENEMPTKDGNINRDAAISNDIALHDNKIIRKVVIGDSGLKNCTREAKIGQDEDTKSCSDDTVVVKFVDTAIVGKSDTEDARHHGLVEPTINTKEAMNDIINMFREPLELSVAGRRPSVKQSSACNSFTHGFKVFTDESLENGVGPSQRSKNLSSMQANKSKMNQPSDEPFEIFIDTDETNDEKSASESDAQDKKSRSAGISASHVYGSVFAKPNDSSECFKDPNPKRAARDGFREDTVVYKFVGSTISDEPEVENVWHHGLVEPTINLKEAMNDINSMFGKPIEYVRKSRPKKQEKVPDVKNNFEDFLILPDDEPDNSNAEVGNVENSLGKRDKVPDMTNNHAGFLILPDDEIDDQDGIALPNSSTKKESDLFEQTLCTKQAMADINKLFAMPMDF